MVFGLCVHRSRSIRQKLAYCRRSRFGHNQQGNGAGDWATQSFAEPA